MNIGFTRQATDRHAYYAFEPGTEERHVIHLKNIVMTNVGNQHTRISTRMISEVADFGGLVDVMYICTWIIVLYCGAPSRELDLGISFNKLMTKINQKHQIQYKSEEMTTAYEKRIDMWFYLKYFVWRRIPSSLHSCFCLSVTKKKRQKLQDNNWEIDEEPKFSEMAEHFDELYL